MSEYHVEKRIPYVKYSIYRCLNNMGGAAVLGPELLKMISKAEQSYSKTTLLGNSIGGIHQVYECLCHA